MAREHGLAPVEKGYVAIGWHEMGNLSTIPPNRDAFKLRVAQAYPEKKPGAVPVNAGVIYRFSSDARTFERTKPNLRLVDGATLIELIYLHYDKFEPRYQMLLPLKRSYIPGPIVTGGA